MEDMVIGLQIKPTIEITNKNNHKKVKLLVENINDVFEENGITIIKYYTSECYSLLTFNAEESVDCIDKHLTLAVALKEICLKMLNELTLKDNDKVEDKRENLSE